ncbi:MAG: hypothetical protein DRI57_00440 [Deltaproteobacteria bacterium]|nr:MAG: hypothetical protein DRI57_00440 [Deltaproteobacteria bacterium]
MLSAFICVHLRLTTEKLFLICRYLKTYGQVLSMSVTKVESEKLKAGGTFHFSLSTSTLVKT